MTSTYLVLLVLSGAFELAFWGVCLMLERHSLRERPLGLDALVGVAAPFVPVYAIKMGVLVFLGGSLFYGVSVAYVTTFIVVPLVGLGVLLLRPLKPASPAVRVVALASLALPFVGVYATFVEPLRLTVERTTVPVDARRLAAPLRVAVLADIQSRRIEPQLTAAVAEAMAFEPHLILLPGDLIQAGPETYERVTPLFRELIAPLEAPLGVYFVLGNTDDPKRVQRVLDGTNVRLLRNERVDVEFEGGTVRIAGADFFPTAPHVVAFVEDVERAPGDDLRILLAHYPDVALGLAPGTRVDLVVAGHTHGGQVQLPLFGPPITLSRVPRRVAAGGLSDLDGRSIYVSRGLGSERGLAPRLRFLAPPEVSLLTLVPERP